MELRAIRRCGVGRAATVALLAGLVGACTEQSVPAPVYMKGGEAAAFTPTPAMRQDASRLVTIRHDQSVDSVARFYHVPAAAIVAANRLRPPYAVKAGARLMIPSDGTPPPVRQASGYGVPPSAAAATPLPPPHPETIAMPPHQATLTPPPTPSQPTPAGTRQASLTPPPSAVPPVPTAPQPPTPPPPAAAKAGPEIIPLDGPPPKQAAAAPGAPPAPLPAAPPPNEAAVDWSNAEGPAAGGRFPWPVRGRVLNYGGTVAGAHNDGINIAAPRGTPVRAIDSGVVAYAGNEVKGYGNLVLIKHANGWISAYAHLDALNLKPGDKIAAGEVIARVGDSGGVGEPQLHFELRRGKRPVDPREFLAPAPSATAPAGDRTG